MSKATIDLQGNELLVIKGISHEIRKDEGQPIVRLISTASIDHDGDIIWQGPNEKGRGWLLDGYNANPKIFFGHQTWEMPLGGGRAFTDKHPVHGLSLFHEDDFDLADPNAATLEGKVRRGFIKESSVGFIGVTMSPREGSAYGKEFFEQRLLEATYCNWGANPDTAVMAKEFLTRHPGVALKVETGDSAAAYQQQKDVADALADYGARIKNIESILIDRQEKQQAADEASKTINPAIGRMVDRLKAAGLIQ